MTNDEELAHDERKKLSAIFLSNIAVAIIATGLVAPFFAMLYGLRALTPEQVRFSGLAAPGWVSPRMGMQYSGRAFLGGLKA